MCAAHSARSLFHIIPFWRCLAVVIFKLPNSRGGGGGEHFESTVVVVFFFVVVVFLFCYLLTKVGYSNSLAARARLKWKSMCWLLDQDLWVAHLQENSTRKDEAFS